MNDEAMADILAGRMRAGVAGRRLPDGFTARLGAAVRRARRRWRVRLALTALLTLATVLATIGIVGSGRRPAAQPEAMLIATQPTPTSDSGVSNLAFLGFFRECLRRTRTNKRKEDEK